MPQLSLRGPIQHDSENADPSSTNRDMVIGPKPLSGAYLEVLSYLADQTSEREFADEKLCGLLRFAGLTTQHHTVSATDRQSMNVKRASEGKPVADS